MLRILAVLAVAALTMPVRAQEPLPHTAAAALPLEAVAGHEPLECLCRANGRLFGLGEQICLRTAEGPRLAECKMVLNNTSWGITDRGCPES